MAKRGVVNKIQKRDEEIRPVRWRKYPHLFLIVCEDANTEPYYFEQFRRAIPENTIYLRTVGTGRSSQGVVEQASVEKNKLCLESNKNVDEIWVVFDKDDADLIPANAGRFIYAFTHAEKEKILIAYSNEAFELWLLLHFATAEPSKPLLRHDINLLLEGAIKKHPAYTNFIYQHGNANVIDAVFKTGNEQKAIERAEKLLKENPRPPIEANPSTTVHLLVKRLRELIEFYSYIPEG